MWHALNPLPPLLQVPTAVRRDLEQLLACSLVKEAATIAKYRVPAVAATLAALEVARDGARLCVLRFLAEVGGRYMSCQ